jgi:hypothetical protein
MSSSTLSGNSICDAASGRGQVQSAAGKRAGGDRQRAQRLAGECVVAPRKLGAALLAERDRLAVLPEIGSVRQQNSGAPLTKTRNSSGFSRSRWTVVWRLRSDVNGISAMRGKLRQLVLGHADFARGDDQRAFGRVALHAPAPSLLVSAASLASAAARKRLRDALANDGDPRAAAPLMVKVALGM